MKAGFSGGMVVDFPHSTRAKKYFLVLMVGSTVSIPAAKGLDGEDENYEVKVSARRSRPKKQKAESFSTVSLPLFLCSAIQPVFCIFQFSLCRSIYPGRLYPCPFCAMCVHSHGLDQASATKYENYP